MQEEITQRTVSLSVEAGKMTADLLQKAVKKVLEEMQKKPSQRTLHQGKQTLHQLKQHGASLTNIEITEQNIKAFSVVAKKYDIDYALKKDPTTEPPHYYVFFKAKDIISDLTGMFDTLNTKVGEIAGEVGMTPADWNSSIFDMIRNLSETVIVPIAGIILTFVMCYELIQLIIEKNNLHDFDTWIFFKWIFKTFCAVLIVTNTWNIVMAVFDVAQNVVSQSAGVIISDAGIDISGVVGDLETQLADWSVGALLGLWFQSVFVGLCTQILSICIFLVIYGRMIEVYLVTSIGPIPFATMVNREWGSTGQNYLRSLLALGFQAFLIMICVGIYAVLVEGISTSGDNISAAIWGCMGYTVLLCYTLFKTGSLAKSLFGAH